MMTATRLPARRADLVIRPIGEEGRYVVKDPSTGGYFQVGPQEYFLLNQLDGVQPVAAVCRAFEAAFGEPLSEDDLGEFLALADAQSLLDAQEVPAEAPHFRPASAGLLGHEPREFPLEPDARPDTIVLPPAAPPPAPATRQPAVPPKKALGGQSLLYLRWSLFNPDQLLNWLAPLLGFVWTRGFLAVSAAGILTAGGVVLANWTDLVSGFTGTIRWQTVGLVWVVLLTATALHELAHGLTLKHFGGEVRQIGLLLIFFFPSMYCNVSDAWLLRERWKRLLVTLSGGYWDLCAWAMAVFIWRLTPLDGLPNYLAFVSMTVVAGRILINTNPFMKLDGYYLLGDLLEVPNLMDHGQERAKDHLRRVLWGAAPPAPHPHAGILTAYGLASWGYGLGLLALGLYGLFAYLTAWIGVTGVGVAAVAGFVLLRIQLKGLAKGEIREMLATRRARAAAWAVIGVAAVAVVTTVPVADRANGPFRVRTGGRLELRSPVAGIVREIRFEEGEVVPAGAVVARLDVPDLASRQARKRAEVAEAKAKLDLLQAGPNPASVTDLAERVVRAERWHALGQKDLERAAAVHKSDLVRLDAAITRFEAEGRQAAATFERQQTLRKQGVASLEEHDIAAAKVEVARGQLQQAKAERQSAVTTGTVAAETEVARRAKELADAVGALTVFKAGPRPEEIAAVRAALDRAAEEARYLDQLSDQLAVTAPKGGVLTTSRPRDLIGRHVQEGELLGEVDDVAAMEVEVTLREGQVSRVAPGQEVDLMARAFPFQTLRGRVVRVAPATRRSGDQPNGYSAMAGAEIEGQIAVYCVLEAGTPELRSGMTGHARVGRGERPLGQILIESALRTVRTEFWR